MTITGASWSLTAGSSACSRSSESASRGQRVRRLHQRADSARPHCTTRVGRETASGHNQTDARLVVTSALSTSHTRLLCSASEQLGVTNSRSSTASAFAAVGDDGSDATSSALTLLCSGMSPAFKR
jgi:hypothetical protein